MSIEYKASIGNVFTCHVILNLLLDHYKARRNNFMDKFILLGIIDSCKCNKHLNVFDI